MSTFNVFFQEDLYFCGEFATPQLALRKMLDEGTIDREEMEKQLQLFHFTLMAILNHKRNPLCNQKAVILTYADLDRCKNPSLADQIADQISAEIKSESKNEPMHLEAEDEDESKKVISCVSFVCGEDKESEITIDGWKEEKMG